MKGKDESEKEEQGVEEGAGGALWATADDGKLEAPANPPPAPSLREGVLIAAAACGVVSADE